MAFASSADALNANTNLNGAILELGKIPIASTGLPTGVDPGSPASILNAVVSQNFGTGVITLEKVSSSKMGQYPTASTVLIVDTGGGVQVVTYVTVFVWKKNLVMAIGISPENDWKQYRPTFDQILHSMIFTY